MARAGAGAGDAGKLTAYHRKRDFAQTPEPAGAPPAAQDQDADGLADAVDTLVAALTGHLAHEEQDGLPLIGVALTAAEWRGVGFKIARCNGLSAGGEMFSWMLSDRSPEETRAVTRQLPPPVRVLYKAAWKPRFEKTKRW